MSRTVALVALVPLLALAAFVAKGCGRPAPPPAAAPRPETEVRTGTVARELDRQKRVADEQAKESDTVARGLLGSFESRVYDPRRDSLLGHAEGTVRVRTSAGEATYRLVFDATFPEERPVRFEPVSEPDGFEKRAMGAVRNWANLACLGAYPVVVFYRPPIPLQIVPTTDRKNMVVLAPVFKTDLSVSYSFDARQVVVGRAEWTSESHKSVTTFDWDPFGGGRYLLRRAIVFEGATTDLDYGDHDGVRLLDRVHVKGGSSPLEAEFTYQTIRRAR